MKKWQNEEELIFSNAETKNAASIDIFTSVERVKRKQVHQHEKISRQKSCDLHANHRLIATGNSTYITTDGEEGLIAKSSQGTAPARKFKSTRL